jgi:hypothetical protein
MKLFSNPVFQLKNRQYWDSETVWSGHVMTVWPIKCLDFLCLQFHWNEKEWKFAKIKSTSPKKLHCTLMYLKSKIGKSDFSCEHFIHVIATSTSSHIYSPFHLHPVYSFQAFRETSENALKCAIWTWSVVQTAAMVRKLPLPGNRMLL